MSPKGRRKRWDTQVKAALIGAAGIIAAAIIGLFAANNSGSTSSNGNGPSPSPKPTSCKSKFRITSPAANANIGKGALIEGEACDLVKEVGWLFNYDFGDKYYHEDNDGPPGPAVTKNGHWSYPDTPIGSPGDPNVPYKLVIVLANQQCNSWLLAIPLTDGDYRTRAFPASCQIAAERVVRVTRPK